MKDGKDFFKVDMVGEREGGIDLKEVVELIGFNVKDVEKEEDIEF